GPVWPGIRPAVPPAPGGLSDTIRSIPIVEPDVTHVIGLVVPHREPMTPMTAALVAEAQKVALTLDRPSWRASALLRNESRREPRGRRQRARSVGCTAQVGK